MPLRYFRTLIFLVYPLLVDHVSFARFCSKAPFFLRESLELTTFYFQEHVADDTASEGRVTLQDLRERGSQFDVPLLAALCADPVLLSASSASSESADKEAFAAAVPAPAATITQRQRNHNKPKALAAAAADTGASNQGATYLLGSSPAGAVGGGQSPYSSSGLNISPSEYLQLKRAQMTMIMKENAARSGLPPGQLVIRRKDLAGMKKTNRRYSVSGVYTTNQVQAPVLKKSSKKPLVTTHQHPTEKFAQKGHFSEPATGN